MPGENVSFIAFGQDHSDRAAMEAVREQLVALHQDLESQGKKMVIGIEHSEGDVRKTSAIREMHNRAVMQIYLEQTPSPSFEDFLKTRGDQLITKEQHPTVRPYTETLPSKIETLFKEQSKVWQDDVNKGKGQARLVESSILDWADLNKVEVRGLDPVTDSEKSRLLTQGTGKIDGSALKAMEYERVQGMGRKSAEVMKGLASTEKGGCLVALNIGNAHLCSVEVALRENLEVQGLKDASVSMCALVPPDRLLRSPSLDMSAHSMMYESVTDMQNTSVNLKSAASALSTLRREESELQRLEPLRQSMDTLPLDDQEFRTMLKENPGKIIDTLEAGGMDRKRVGKILAAANEKVSGSDYTKSAREFVMKNLGVRDSDLKTQRESLTDATQKLETALTTLTPQEKEALYFSQKVNERLNNRPGDVFKSLSSGQDGSYDLKDLSLVRKTSVAESLGMRASSSSTPLSYEREHGVDEGANDNSTRAQLKRSGSFTKPGGDSATSQGTTPPKVVHGLQ
jgi:hypothetical protein